MAAKGLWFSHYILTAYRFQEIKTAEYTYRIQFMNKSHSEQQEYAPFIEASGIELVQRYGPWLFLRKKTVDGPFELFSDNESKMKHYQQMLILYLVFTFVMLSQISGWLNSIYEKDPTSLVIQILLTVGWLLFASMSYITWRKIIKLRQASNISER